MKTIHIILILIVVIAVAVIITTFSDASTYVTFAQASEKPGKEYHVIGTLNRDREIVYDAENNPNLFSFYMLDQDGKERRIIYHNAKPQDFEKSEQVVIIGSAANDSVFEARSLLLKCPSKYNDEDAPQAFGESSFESLE